MLDWIVIDEKYLDYLRSNVESRIPRVNYGVDHYKPFFGVLFETDKFAYVTQVSHPQPRHNSLKASLDFIKVFIGSKLMCVINLNYMFSIPKDKVQYLQYSNISSYRSFANEKEKNNYIALLKAEMSAMQGMKIENKAKRVYSLKNTQPESSVAKRCFDFKNLESECSKYYGLDKAKEKQD